MAHYFPIELDWMNKRPNEKTQKELDAQIKKEKHDAACFLGKIDEVVPEINKHDHSWIAHFTKSPFYDQTLDEKENLTRAANVLTYFAKNGLPETLVFFHFLLFPMFTFGTEKRNCVDSSKTLYQANRLFMHPSD